MKNDFTTEDKDRYAAAGRLVISAGYDLNTASSDLSALSDALRNILPTFDEFNKACQKLKDLCPQQ